MRSGSSSMALQDELAEKNKIIERLQVRAWPSAGSLCLGIGKGFGATVGCGVEGIGKGAAPLCPSGKMLQAPPSTAVLSQAGCPPPPKPHTMQRKLEKMQLQAQRAPTPTAAAAAPSGRGTDAERRLRESVQLSAGRRCLKARVLVWAPLASNGSTHHPAMPPCCWATHPITCLACTPFPHCAGAFRALQHVDSGGTGAGFVRPHTSPPAVRPGTSPR